MTNKKRKPMSELPTMQRTAPPATETPLVASTVVKIEPQETKTSDAEVADDIIFVTVTIPVSRKPRGLPPRAFDLRPKSKDRETLRQIFDGCDATRQSLSDGTEVRSTTKAILKVLELVRDEIDNQLR